LFQFSYGQLYTNQNYKGFLPLKSNFLPLKIKNLSEIFGSSFIEITSLKHRFHTAIFVDKKLRFSIEEFFKCLIKLNFLSTKIVCVMDGYEKF